MRGLNLDRPPRWGVICLLVLLAVNVALLVLLSSTSNQEASAGGAGLAAAAGSLPATPSAVVSTAEQAPQEPEVSPVLAVYGDGYAAGNEQGGVGDAGWPALVAQQNGLELSLHAVSQAGYVSLGTTGQDYVDLVETEPVPEAAVTVLFGSRNDQGEDAATVAARAAQAIQQVQENAPQTTVVVIGPVWDDGAAPADVLAIRDAVQGAAAAAGVAFVDPLAEGWFSSGTGLISSDGISPTDEGNVYLADEISPVVQTALASVPSTP